MKKLQNTSFYFLIIILLISCGQKTGQETQKITEQSIIKEVETAESDLNIIKTPDLKYVFYSFDDGNGGTMRSYKTYIQFKDESENAIFLQWQDKVRFDYTNLYTEIWQFENKGITYYVAKTFRQGSNCSWGYGMEIFTLTNGIPTYHTEFYPNGIYEPYEYKTVNEYYTPAYDVDVCYTEFCNEIDYIFNPTNYTVYITEYDESQPEREQQKTVKRSWQLVIPNE
jgi:hypothetical protein